MMESAYIDNSQPPQTISGSCMLISVTVDAAQWERYLTWEAKWNRTSIIEELMQSQIALLCERRRASNGMMPTGTIYTAEEIASAQPHGLKLTRDDGQLLLSVSVNGMGS